jgi:hypothetical protein
LSGLKINLLKSEVCCLGKAEGKVEQYVVIFTCAEGNILFK